MDEVDDYEEFQRELLEMVINLGKTRAKNWRIKYIRNKQKWEGEKEELEKRLHAKERELEDLILSDTHEIRDAWATKR